MKITDLLEITSTSEKKEFIRFLSKRSKNGYTNSILLFKAFLNGKESQKKKEWGANRYHVIKKRLGDNLSSFLAEQVVEKEAMVEVTLIKKLLLARKFIRFKKFKPALQLLSKALEQAKEHQLLSIQNEIYHSMLECSLEVNTFPQEQIVKEFQNNLSSYEEQEQRTIANTRLKKAFKDAEHEGRELTMDQELEKYKKELSHSKTQKFDFKDLLEMASIADAQGNYTKNYAGVNVFFIQRMRELEKAGEMKAIQLPYRIQLIYLIANIYFRKKEFNKSLTFLDEMKTLMEKEAEVDQSNYEVQYISLLALNLNFLGFWKKAVLLLDQYLSSKSFVLKKGLNPLLIRSMIAFQQGDFKLTAKLFANFQERDKDYEKLMGIDWLLNKKYIEILLHIELGNDDLVDSRIASIIKKHGDYLASKSAFRILPFLKLVKSVYRNPNAAQQDGFEAKVDKVLIRKPSEQEDLFLICFYAWLKSKMTKQDIYSTTLELVSS